MVKSDVSVKKRRAKSEEKAKKAFAKDVVVPSDSSEGLGTLKRQSDRVEQKKTADVKKLKKDFEMKLLMMIMSKMMKMKIQMMKIMFQLKKK